MNVTILFQIECNPYLTQKKLINFCQSRGIEVTAYSPMGSPDSPYLKAGMPRLLEDPGLHQVAHRVGKSVGQVVLRYLVRDLVTSREEALLGSGGKASRNFSFGTRGLVGFTPRPSYSWWKRNRYPWGKGLGGLQVQFGRSGKDRLVSTSLRSKLPVSLVVVAIQKRYFR